MNIFLASVVALSISTFAQTAPEPTVTYSTLPIGSKLSLEKDFQFDVGKNYRLMHNGCFVELGYRFPEANEMVTLKAPKKYVLARAYARGEYSETGLLRANVWHIFIPEGVSPAHDLAAETDLIISCGTSGKPMEPKDVAAGIEDMLGPIALSDGPASTQLSTAILKTQR